MLLLMIGIEMRDENEINMGVKRVYIESDLLTGSTGRDTYYVEYNEIFASSGKLRMRGAN